MAKRSKGGNTAALVTQLAQPICEQCGVQLWDVLYIKEGSDWFLRVIIDRDPAVDCHGFSLFGITHRLLFQF